MCRFIHPIHVRAVCLTLMLVLSLVITLPAAPPIEPAETPEAAEPDGDVSIDIGGLAPRVFEEVRQILQRREGPAENVVPVGNVVPFDPFAGANAKGRAWGPEQATGAPDTPGAGDIQSAWASLTQDGADEWLELTYDKAVVPVEVVIHETFNPGAIHKISVMADDREHVVWEGDDPTPTDAERGVSKIKVDTDLETHTIRVYLKSRAVPGWNEIDAVGLVGKDAELQWAEEAEASSTYADIQVRAQLVPFGVAAVPAAPTDEQLQQMLQDRERQLAKMIKKVRDGERALVEMQEALNEFEAKIQQLQLENRRLRNLLQQPN